MARDGRYLKRWEVFAGVLVAVLLMPMVWGFGWLEANHPRVAIAVFVVGYGCAIGLIGSLAWARGRWC